jgi:hypothetical protein
MNDASSFKATRTVSTGEEMVAVAGAAEVTEIRVIGKLHNLRRLRLAAGQCIRGDGEGSALYFAQGEDGVELTSGNVVTDLAIATDPHHRALFNDPSLAGLGRIEISRLTLVGNIRLLSLGAAGGHVEGHNIHIEDADATAFEERPAGFGVEVVPAVFTIWNMHSDSKSRVTADLTGISVGRAGQPVRGGAVFVCGTPGGGSIIVRRLETGEIHSDGRIPAGTPDRISGGVFVVHGAWVDAVRNRGPVTTYGSNDMVLDNWGTVETWQADAKITSHGPSGIGFVNFGMIDTLRVNSVIETFGRGARGFNVYAGTVRDAEFERVITHADGAVGIQIGQPIGRLVVRRGIETHGGVGDSLVKGVVKQLPATALSIKPGGSAREITVRGGIITRGDRIEPIEMHGVVDAFSVMGSLAPHGGGFESM